MRFALPLFSLLFLGSTAFAQHITTVTVTPTPLHACQEATLHIIGTAPPGMSFTFVQNNITTTSITMVIEASGPGSGSTSFNQPLGPYGPFDAGTYSMSVSLQYNGTITSTWTGSLTVLPAVVHNLGEMNSIYVCPNAAPFPLLSQLGGTPDAGGSWIDPQLQPVPNGMFTPGTSPEGVFLYYFPVPPPCQPDYQFLTILYNPNNSAGGSVTVPLCTAAGAPPVDLFTRLGGTPMAGGTWTGPGGNTSGIFTPGTSLPGQYVYMVDGIAPCTNPTATVTVTGAPASNPGVGGSAEFCWNETAAVLNNYVTGESNTGVWFSPQGYGIDEYGAPINLVTYGPGTYMYVVTTPPCPADTSFVTVTLVGPPCTIGIADVDAAPEALHVVPNPATGTVSVEIGPGEAGRAQYVEIYDVNGKLLRHEPFNTSGGISRKTMDISGLAPGAYLLRWTGGRGTVARRLMVE